MGKNCGEEGVRRNENGGTTGQGIMGAAIEQVDLQQKQEGQTEQWFLFPGFHFEGNPHDLGPDPDGDSTQEETDACKGERRYSGERHLDGNRCAPPEDGGEGG